MYQYKVTVNQTSQIFDSYPDWENVFRQCNERGYPCSLDRRLVYKNPDPEWILGLKDDSGNLPAGSALINNLFIGQWDRIADNNNRSVVLISGTPS